MSFKELQQFATRCVVSGRLLSGLFAAVVLTGCTATSPIMVDDKKVFQPSLKVTVNLDADKQGAADQQTGHVVEFGLTKAKGSGDQTLAAGTPPIIIKKISFSAPQQVRNDFDMTFAEMSWRWRKFFRERSIGLELSAGLGHSSLGLTVSSLTQSASDRYSSYGPQGGVALIWRMPPSTSIHMRASAYFSGSIEFKRQELFLAQALGDNLSLRAGYAHWNVTSSVLGDNSVEIDFSGPVLGIGMDF
jgi:hypothetical protein